MRNEDHKEFIVCRSFCTELVPYLFYLLGKPLCEHFWQKADVNILPDLKGNDWLGLSEKKVHFGILDWQLCPSREDAMTSHFRCWQFDPDGTFQEYRHFFCHTSAGSNGLCQCFWCVQHSQQPVPADFLFLEYAICLAYGKTYICLAGALFRGKW